jgi:hypothetical protein
MDKGTGLRNAIAVAEYDQAHAAAMETLADAQAFLLITGNDEFELAARVAVLNGSEPGFLVAATAVAACSTNMAVCEVSGGDGDAERAEPGDGLDGEAEDDL